ncbi:sigma 54-interacting transcriptional regulator [Methylomonas sp. SURF-1]|uniref:Sigma 54-interacting transcriptional regulator n=1 Tax=Methylomonas aurea TaxID=2952224 RepID=A0ABT1UGB8_9GAMM|nr:sigma 54-interacting transcriptional regulator [Methylomonas sp. SURF-1]MCQ8181076.1 sigma 54-interacting transcriptional regulator [Methylomonas sp. SURF-1]
MSEHDFSQISPVFFLQTFILELMHACEQKGGDYCESLIEHIAKSAGLYFEQTYRAEYGKRDELDRESYIDLILALKNHIGGNFSLASVDAGTVTVVNSRCPFGERVTNFPELCRMTSSVFGGIAARNFGYAKVEIKRSIARQHGGCEVCIHTDRSSAAGKPGLEYRRQDQPDESREMAELHSRIEERMRNVWWSKPKHQSIKPPPAIVAKSPAMQKVLQQVEIVAPTRATVLVNGETGVGKELIARAIHAMSERGHRPFVAINCGAIPESLIESALFGHEKGAFTGALEVHQGFFERAEGGTLFLDEVDTLSQAAQTRLLRVLQEGEMERVGGKHTLSVDVRIVSACNRPLQQAVEQGLFRQDLFYRLNVVKLWIPPLAQRPEDLPHLVQLILQRLSEKYARPRHTVSREVMNQIRAYRWPGNVRELENTLERSFLFSPGNELTHLELDQPATAAVAQDWNSHRQQILDAAEQTFLKQALQHHRGDVKQVAADMNLTPRAVYGKLKKYGISAGQFK